jgi:hypothetical protein
VFVPSVRSPASPSLSMAHVPKQVRLQKTLKEGLRRCVYRRWEAKVEGAVLITKTTDLERMYRGNTPYPIGKPSFRSYSYPTRAKALVALESAIRRRRSQGYSAA